MTGVSGWGIVGQGDGAQSRKCEEKSRMGFDKHEKE